MRSGNWKKVKIQELATTPQRRHQEEVHEMSGLMSELPKEIFLDILLRLPIKSISPCRWVSKAWYHTIRDPHFINTYNTKVINNNSPCIMFEESAKDVYLVDHESLNASETSPTFYSSKLPCHPISNLCSCNGLVLSGGAQPYCVFNPIIGKYIVVPKSPMHGEETGLALTGFGYDSVSKVFKVVRIFDIWSGKPPCRTYLEVYNVDSGKWRAVDNVVPCGALFFFRNSAQNVILKGALHWLANVFSRYRGIPGVRSSLNTNTIVCFNLDTEGFQQLPLPPGVRLSTNKFCSYLLVLGDCLSLVYPVNDEHVEIWVMKDYGLKSSWAKEYIIRDMVMDTDIVKGPYKPITLMQNGEMLILCSYKYLGYYNPRTKVFRSIDTGDLLHWSVVLRPSLHVATLISPWDITSASRGEKNEEGRREDNRHIIELEVPKGGEKGAGRSSIIVEEQDSRVDEENGASIDRTARHEGTVVRDITSTE